MQESLVRFKLCNNHHHHHNKMTFGEARGIESLRDWTSLLQKTKIHLGVTLEPAQNRTAALGVQCGGVWRKEGSNTPELEVRSAPTYLRIPGFGRDMGNLNSPFQDQQNTQLLKCLLEKH